jgi:SAM-dependent methyltransferase
LIANKVHRLPSRLLALYRAIRLGSLDSQGLTEITRLHYQRPNGFEAEAHNLSGLWPWESEVVGSYLERRPRLLVAGAGGGREAIALARLGHAVTAFDFCDALVAACRRNMERAGVKGRVLDAPPDRLPPELGIYDGIVAGRGFYHHIPGRARRIAFLRSCHQHLTAGGPLFISDFFTRPPADRAWEKRQRIANLIRAFMREPERVERGDWLTDCMQHAFTPDEIESELREAGFRLALYADSPIGEGAHLAHAVGIADPRIAIHGEWVPRASDREPSASPAAHVFGGPA